MQRCFLLKKTRQKRRIFPFGVAFLGFCGIFCSVMSLFKSFLLQIAVGVLGFYLADYFLEEVQIESVRILFYAGGALGIINFFIRPIIRIITFPLRLLTLGLFTFFINIAIVWFTQALFTQVSIEGLTALLYTTLIIWVLEFIIHSFSK